LPDKETLKHGFLVLLFMTTGTR